MADHPRFSIVIPTRNRARTLPSTLATCLRQDFDDFEIIIADNCSRPPVAEVLADLPARVRLVRSNVPLALSDNWEFAVSQARGGFVGVVGDDDGLMPGALARIDGLIREFGADAVTSAQAMYLWPGTPGPSAGRLMIPVMRPTEVGPARGRIAEVAAFRQPYSRLPMLYNSFVKRDVLDRIHSKAGRLFPDPIPDVFSGFAVAWEAGNCVRWGEPLGVAALSGTSNGIAQLFPRKGGADPGEFFDLNRRAGLIWNQAAPDVRSLSAVAAHSFGHAAERVFGAGADVRLDEAALVRSCAAELAALEPPDWESDIAVLRRWAAGRPEAVAALEPALAAHPNRPRPFDPLPHLGFDRHNLAMIVDAAALGSADVAAAAALADSLFRYRTRPPAWGPEVRRTDAGAK